MEVDRAWWDVAPVGGKAYGEGVKIGQLDTGWSGHPEVDAGRVDLANARGFSPGRADGFDNLQITSVNSEPGHGTNCASISISGFNAAGGGGTNPASVVGIAPAARLLPIRVCDATADFRQSYLAQGLDYAVAQNCDVLTMSIGQLLPSVAVHNACHRAIAANRIVVAAAGQCVLGMVVVPASVPGVIPVGGLTRAGGRWGPSSVGERCVYALSEGIRVAAVSEDASFYVNLGSGTSYAAAGAAGVAALWLAHFGRARLIAALHPGDTLQAAFTRALRRTSVPVPGLVGAGRIDAYALLSEAEPLAGFVRPQAMASPPFSWTAYTIQLLPYSDQARFSALLAQVGPPPLLERYGEQLYAMTADTRLAMPDYDFDEFEARFRSSLALLRFI